MRKINGVGGTSDDGGPTVVIPAWRTFVGTIASRGPQKLRARERRHGIRSRELRAIAGGDFA